MGGPDTGALGTLLFFFLTLIAEIVISLYVFAYAAHCFLVILINTAAGDDEIKWPDDLFTDWFLRVWHFLWLLAVWLVPAHFIMKLLHAPAPLYVAGIVTLLWLIFPVSLLSSLSSLSSWVVFRPVILRALLMHFGPLAGFYVITGGLLAVCSGLWYAGILTDYAVILPVAAMAGALGFFIYARLLGRIGLIVSWYNPPVRGKGVSPSDAVEKVQLFDPWGLPETEEENTPSADDAPRPPRSQKKTQFKRKKRKNQGAGAYDPWSLPPELAHGTPPDSETEDPLGPATGTYGISAADAPLPLQPRTELPDPTVEGFAVAEPDAQPITPPQPLTSPQVAKYELALAIRRRPAVPPAKPLTTGVFNFPFYQDCIVPMALVAFGFLAVGGLLRLLIMLFPDFWREH